MTTVSKVTTFAGEDALQDAKFLPFANFKDSDSPSMDQSDDDVEDFGDLSKPAGEAHEVPVMGVSQGSGPVVSEVATDDFGEFQSEKPKISKFDFLLATSQGKVKSSEEMIKSELATFDLSVQGEHQYC